jgi:hypothetical protein
MAAELVGQVNDGAGNGRKVQWDPVTEDVLVEVLGSAGTKFLTVGKARNKLDAIQRAKRSL